MRYLVVNHLYLRLNLELYLKLIQDARILVPGQEIIVDLDMVTMYGLRIQKMFLQFMHI